MPPAPLTLDDYLPYLVNRVGVALVCGFGEEAARHGLSIEMWRVVVVLGSAGPQRHVDLAALASIERSTLSRMVTRLVDLGYVTRQRAIGNNREVEVALAPDGRATLERLTPVARRYEALAGAGIPPGELDELKRLLVRVYGNLAAPAPAETEPA